MSDEVVQVSYGYQDDEVKVNPFVFGLNAGNTFLTKFEYTPTGGKDGAQQEALDIIFNINGTDKSYRMFPITKVFGANQEEITDPSNATFKKTVIDFGARITHIIHCFVSTEVYLKAISVPQNDSFKSFCQIAASVLPKNFKEIPLDIFLQYQWQIADGKDRAYLELPKKMAYGKWICKAQPGTWEEIRATKFDDKTTIALKYGKVETAERDADGNITKYTEFHPITKNGWFLASNFANQQRAKGAPSSNGVPVNTAVADAAIAGQPNNPVASTGVRKDMW